MRAHLVLVARAAVLLGVFAPAIHADTLVFTNGARLEGVVQRTNPRVEALAAGEKGHILGTAADETSPVRRLEFQVDGQEWHPFHSKDGLLDSKVEAFDLELPPLAPGAHVLAVRATDARGNTGTALLVLP